MSLKGARVLVVEDDLLIARDLSLQLEDEGAEVVGPVVSAKGALQLIEREGVSAAILDARVQDGSITPAAEALIARRIPLVFHTGAGLPNELKARHPELPVFDKPASIPRLIETLSGLMNDPQPPPPKRRALGLWRRGK